MKCSDFTTTTSSEEMAAEISFLKATVSLLLKAMPQADSGKVLTQLESMIPAHQNAHEAEIFDRQLQQMKSAYRE
jgi:hypothetical protein